MNEWCFSVPMNLELTLIYKDFVGWQNEFTYSEHSKFTLVNVSLDITFLICLSLLVLVNYV